MRLITFHDGKLLTDDASCVGPEAAARQGFTTGLPQLDALAPAGAFARGAIHELLANPGDEPPLFLAMLLAIGGMSGMGGPPMSLPYSATLAPVQTPPDEAKGGGQGGMRLQGAAGARMPPSSPPRDVSSGPAQHKPDDHSGGIFIRPASSSGPPSHSSAVFWCDPAAELYPPALAAYGFPLDRLILLRPAHEGAMRAMRAMREKDWIWAMAEALGCRGVGAVVAAPPRLSRIEARRLQLAAERGGGVGILLRQTGRSSAHHAAATRWLVRPAPGARTLQRWNIQLLHGHGGQLGKTLCLEHCRETNHLRTFDPLAHRQTPTQPGRAAS